MRVVIAGGHGQIALRLIPRLVAEGDEVIGLIRNPDHAAELEALGAQATVCDLEDISVAKLAVLIEGAGVVIFAAGAGPGSGAARKLTMDLDGAVRLLYAGLPFGARYLMVSATGAEDPPSDDEVFSVYLRAKQHADFAVENAAKEFTILRPGQLLNDPGTGRVRLGVEPFRGAITRDDVAALLAALVRDPTLAARQIVYASGGDTPIAQALRALDAG